MSTAEQYRELLELNARDDWKKVEIGKVTDNEIELIITVKGNRSYYSHVSKASNILAAKYSETLVMPLIVVHQSVGT